MIAWLGKILAGLFGLKSFLNVAFMAVLGIIFYNLAVEMVQEAMTFSINQINGQSYGSVTSPSFSGFAGWVIAQMKLPECVSVIASCVALKFILRKIPFLRW
jgi:ABC-type branched-subunit amino acid transport system permease subunit